MGARQGPTAGRGVSDGWRSRRIAGVNERETERMLSGLAAVEIAIDIETADGPLDRIDFPVPVSIQLLEMIMHELGGLRARHAVRAGVETRIIAAPVLKQAVVHEIGSGPHQSFWRNPLTNLYVAAACSVGHLGLRRHSPGFFLRTFGLPLGDKGYGGFPRPGTCGLLCRLRQRLVRASGHRGRSRLLGLLLSSLSLSRRCPDQDDRTG